MPISLGAGHAYRHAWITNRGSGSGAVKSFCKSVYAGFKGALGQYKINIHSDHIDHIIDTYPQNKFAIYVKRLLDRNSQPAEVGRAYMEDRPPAYEDIGDYPLILSGDQIDPGLPTYGEAMKLRANDNGAIEDRPPPSYDEAIMTTPPSGNNTEAIKVEDSEPASEEEGAVIPDSYNTGGNQKPDEPDSGS